MRGSSLAITWPVLHARAEVRVQLGDPSRHLAADLHRHQRRQRAGRGDAPGDVAALDAGLLQLEVRLARRRARGIERQPAAAQPQDRHQPHRDSNTSPHRSTTPRQAEKLKPNRTRSSGRTGHAPKLGHSCCVSAASVRGDCGRRRAHLRHDLREPAFDQRLDLGEPVVAVGLEAQHQHRAGVRRANQPPADVLAAVLGTGRARRRCRRSCSARGTRPARASRPRT